MDQTSVTVLLVVSIVLSVLSCTYLFCWFLPRHDHGRYYDRSEIMNYERDHGGETVGDIEARNLRDDDGHTNPEQVAAMERMDLIHNRVIKKNVVDSAEAGNRKSNIRIPFTAIVRNWVSRLPSLRDAAASAPTLDAVRPPPAACRDRTPDAPRRTSVTFREEADGFSVEEESSRSKRARWTSDGWANGGTLEPTPDDDDDDGGGTQGLTERGTNTSSTRELTERRTSVTFREEEDGFLVEKESPRSKRGRWTSDGWANGGTLEPTPDNDDDDDDGGGCTQGLTERGTNTSSTQELTERRTNRLSVGSTLTTLSRSLLSLSSTKSVPYTPDKCLICMESYKAGDSVYWSPNDSCDHSFHADCMFRWLMNNDDCPLCRQNYLNGSAEAGGRA